MVFHVEGVFGTVSTSDPEKWTPEPQVLLPFMGLMLAVMSWIAYHLQQWRRCFPQGYSLMISVVLLAGVLVLATHAVVTYKLNNSGLSIVPPTEVRGV